MSGSKAPEKPFRVHDLSIWRGLKHRRPKLGREVGEGPVFAERETAEIALESAGRKVLAAVTGLDSNAKKAGDDFIFMVCSEACGGQLRAAVASDLARRG
jgi:hypothetical protein